MSKFVLKLSSLFRNITIGKLTTNLDSETITVSMLVVLNNFMENLLNATSIENRFFQRAGFETVEQLRVDMHC